MKHDKHISALSLTRNQEFFVSTWFNSVHAHSLDSFRVRAMNARNVVRELQRLYGPLGKTEERSIVRAEAHQVLSKDPVLKTGPFAWVLESIQALLSDSGDLVKSKEDGPAKNLLLYFLAETERLIEQHYVNQSLDLLRELLNLNGAQPQPETDRFAEIEYTTRSFLSVLIDRKASLESLYTIHSEILVPRNPKATYSFNRRFELAAALLTRPASDHYIALAIDDVSDADRFPDEIGGVRFSVDPPFTSLGKGKSRSEALAKKYLSPMPRRLFASKLVNAQDPRTAGSEAAESVNQLLNLVRFEYERNRVVVHDEFAFIQPDRVGSSPRVFSLPGVVPNPAGNMEDYDLPGFIQSVNELVLNGSFQQEGRDRVLSAFRLYRIGLDTTVLENKLVSWWTALEYLARGSSVEAGGIGKSVEFALTPTLCNMYLAKHLQALRTILLDLGLKLTDPVSGGAISLKGMSLHDIYLLLKRNDVQQLILGEIQGEVFIHHHANAFFQALNDPVTLHQRNAEHERRLRWHLQRLWRARCDIVHSAERMVSASLLCANLEYYLKTTLLAILKALRGIPTLSGPREFFDRQSHRYGEMQLSLLAGDDSKLTRELRG